MKRIEITNTSGEQVQMIWRKCWGNSDRYLIMSPSEARLLASQLMQSADRATSDPGRLGAAGCHSRDLIKNRELPSGYVTNRC